MEGKKEGERRVESVQEKSEGSTSDTNHGIALGLLVSGGRSRVSDCEQNGMVEL